jgi:hypothetical protein
MPFHSERNRYLSSGQFFVFVFLVSFLALFLFSLSSFPFLVSRQLGMLTSMPLVVAWHLYICFHLLVNLGEGCIMMLRFAFILSSEVAGPRGVRACFVLFLSRRMHCGRGQV